MTKVIVHSGVCGFAVTIRAEMDKDKKIHITLDTECEMVRKMSGDVETLGMRDAFTGLLSNPVYRAAASYLTHAACPAPSGILKALEVEAGLCLPRNVSMEVIKEEGDKKD
jgi:hypothetical protein